MIKRIGISALFLAITLLNLSSSSLDPVKRPSYNLKTIVIDAGHGGKDSGTRGSKVWEKNISLSIAIKLGGYIEKYLPDVNVVYTRKTDTYITLDGRAEIANSNEADLFVSVHVNAMPAGKTTVKGTETYVMGLHKSKENLNVAIRENSVIKDEENFLETYGGFEPDSDESYIMMNLIQNAYLESSLSLAEKIQYQFGNRVNRKDRGVKQAGFWVLWATTMPSVLVEVGYITNPEEEKYLASEEGQALIASGIFRAIRDYKSQVELINTDK